LSACFDKEQKKKKNYPEIKKIINTHNTEGRNYTPEYNIVLYCIPEESAANSVLPGDPYIG